MKSFNEFISDESKPIEEGVIRSSALVVMSNRSKAEGNKAVKAFKDGKKALSGNPANQTVEERLECLESAISAQLDGLISMQGQIGSGIIVDVIGHSLKARRTRKV